MPRRESAHGYWSSTRIFVTATAAAAIGLGNLWRMPSLMGEYGGGAFLLVYIFMLAVVALPLMVAELMIGRWARRNVVGSVRIMALEGGAHPAWVSLGWMALVAAIIVLSYYSVIAGWSMAYLIRAASGVFGQGDEETVSIVFRELVADPERALAWHTIFIVICTVVVAQGVRYGLEPVARYFLPAAFVLLLLTLCVATVTADMSSSLVYLLGFDFSALGWRGVLEALLQAFFGLGLGVGVMTAFGALLPSDVRLFRNGLKVITLHTLFSVLGGLAIFAFVFAAGLSPTNGVRLVFHTLPMAVIPTSGSLVLAMFYLILVLLALTTAVSLMEAVVQRVTERFQQGRIFAACNLGLIMWFLGLGTLGSFSFLQDLRLFDRTVFDWLSLIGGRILIPLVGLGLCVFVARILPISLLREAWEDGDERSFQYWFWCLVYPARIGLILVLLYATGLLDMLIRFWTPAGV